MAYNRRNKLLQMQSVIATYQKYKQPGVSTTYVYYTYIRPLFHISIATLYNYLSTPVNRELKEIDYNISPSIPASGVQLSLL